MRNAEQEALALCSGDDALAALRTEALAQGHRDEICGKCGVLFMAHHHFVRCAVRPCEMVSVKEPRSLLDIMGA